MFNNTGERGSQNEHTLTRSMFIPRTLNRIPGWMEQILTPISKGQYVIILHVGNENSFIDNFLLIIKSCPKIGRLLCQNEF